MTTVHKHTAWWAAGGVVLAGGSVALGVISNWGVAALVGSLLETAYFGLLPLGLSRRKDQRDQIQTPPETVPVEGRSARVTSAEAWGETDSLDVYIRSMRSTLEELRHDQAPFVPLTTSTEPRSAVEELLPGLEWQRRARPQQLEMMQPEKIDLESIPDRFRRSALLGEPGSGKSTCLIELARRQLRLAESALVAGQGDTRTQIAPLPLYVSLSRWEQPGQSATAFLQTQLAERLGPGNFLARDFENQLAGGRFLLLLDGLNEIPHRRVSPGEGRHERPDGSAADFRPQRQAGTIDPRERSLRELADDHPLCHIVVTCRSHEYFDSLAWQVVRVLPMDSDQIDCFVEAYLEPAAAIQLQQEIRRRSTLAAIATNPFFLCSVIGAYEPGAELGSRGVILHSLFRKLLEREQRRIGPEAPDGKQVASWAGAVAYHMLRRGELGEHAPLPSADGRDQKYCDTLAGTGLLIHRAGQFHFRHQLVQEYFAATGLRLRIVHRRPATLLADQRWSEVVALWCNLDSRLDRRLVRCLAARNLPWRRPRSYPTAALSIFECVSSTVFVVTAICVCLDLLLGPASALTSPFGMTPIRALVVAAVLVALRVPWSCLNPHRRVIVNAAYVLGRTGYAAALPNMIKAMGRVWHAERAQIADAIAQFGTDSLDNSLEHIDRGLRSRRFRVRAGSVQALGALAARFPDNDAVLSKLVAAAARDDPGLARPLIEALGRLPQSQAREALASVLARVGRGSPFTSGMRLQPLQTLSARLPDQPWEAELIRLYNEHAKPTEPLFMRLVMLQAIGALRLPGSADELAAMAADSNEPQQLRNVAVVSLGRIGSSAAAAHLIQLATSPTMREQALNALNQLQDAEALPELIDAVRQEDWHVRRVAARALGRIGRADAIPVLNDLVEDPDEDVRTDVAQALAVAGHKSAVPALLRLARDPHHEVREAALDGLTQSYPDLAMQELLKLAQDNAYKNRATAIRGLARYNSPEVEKVLRRLGGDADRQVSTLAQRTLEDVEARHHRGLQPWYRHPLERSREFIVRRLEWEGVSFMFREEKLAGTPFGQRISKVQQRIGADAEMMRRYRPLLTLYFWMITGVLVMVGLLTLLALRLSLSGAHVIVHHWAVVLVVLGAAGATFLPGIRKALDIRVLGASLWIVRFAAAVIITVLALGALTYTWWIWVLILMACALGAALRYSWLSVRRGRHLSAPPPSTAAQQMEAA